VVDDKLGRHADVQAELAKLKAPQGDASALKYAMISANVSPVVAHTTRSSPQPRQRIRRR
jgi:hypothetical protein